MYKCIIQQRRKTREKVDVLLIAVLCVVKNALKIGQERHDNSVQMFCKDDQEWSPSLHDVLFLRISVEWQEGRLE